MNGKKTRKNNRLNRKTRKNRNDLHQEEKGPKQKINKSDKQKMQKIMFLMIEIIPRLQEQTVKGGAKGEEEDDEDKLDEILEEASQIDKQKISDPKTRKKLEELQKKMQEMQTCKSKGCFDFIERFWNNLYTFFRDRDLRMMYESLLEYFDRKESSEIVVRVYKSLFNNQPRHDLVNTKIFLKKDSNLFSDMNEVENLFRTIKNTYNKLPPQLAATERKIVVDRNPVKLYTK